VEKNREGKVILKWLIGIIGLAVFASACLMAAPTETKAPFATRTTRPSDTIRPSDTPTYMPMCTPPLCAIGTSEVYYCRDTCPNGCGTVCATYTPSPTGSLSPTAIIAGDLGWGDISGLVTDAASGAPIAGATVTCEHFSFTSPARCNGSTLTDAQGKFLFRDIFFHDTDRIFLSVEAQGYEPQVYKQDFFIRPELIANISMQPLGPTPIIMCTPPPCKPGEVYYCPGNCPGGCGTVCTTPTPTP
jgi:hypothetical protein